MNQVQVELEFPTQVEQTVNIMLKNASDDLGSKHFQAINAEKKRRADKKAEEIRRQQQIEKETKERRQNRANQREKIRIEILEETIINDVKLAPTGEWSPKMAVFDLRELNDHHDQPCIYTFGGLLGELVLTLSTINDYILANSQHLSGLNFFDIEHYISVLMTTEFPPQALKLDLVEDPKSITADDLAAFAMEPKNIASFGLRFLMDVRKKINLGGAKATEDVFKAVANITMKSFDTPNMPDDADPEENDSKLERMIKALDDLKERVVIKYWSKKDFEEANAIEKRELCYVKLRNYKEENFEVSSPAKSKLQKQSTIVSKNEEQTPFQRPDTALTHDSKHESMGESDYSSFDDATTVIRIVNSYQPNFSLIVQHCEAVLQVRKHLINEAVKTFPTQLTAECMREIQLKIYEKQRVLEKLFEEYLLQQGGFGTAFQYEDK